MTISEQIKVLCVRSDISVAELARRIGTTPQNFNGKMKRESFTIAELEDIAGAAGNASSMAVSQPVQKRVIEAMPEDIKQLAKQWDSIVHSIEEPLKRTHLLNSHVTLAEDGQSLELMTSSPTAYELFSREDDKAELVALIEERTGIHVNLIVTKLQDGEDFQNRFTDIRESVNMEIEVDDKEEYI